MPGLGSGGRMFESYHSEEEKKGEGEKEKEKEEKEKRKKYQGNRGLGGNWYKDV